MGRAHDEGGTDPRGRVWLVTGSARGLGRAVAEAALARGERVHVVRRGDPARYPDLEARFGARVHAADVTRAADVERLVAGVLAADGRLDVLVHAVGEYVSGPLETTGAADLRRMLASNVESALLVFDAARPALREARGRAVFFGCSGLEGFRARRETAAYAAAKSALLVLVRAWAVEEAPHGVTVNLVSPGHVPHEGAHPDTLDPERHARIPAGRPGAPEDVARAVGWLVSPEAAYTTGTDLLVTGGWML